MFMAVKTYAKNEDYQLSKNFKSSEFDCHGSGCCLLTTIDDELVKYLQLIRDYFNKPVNISSGYRCPTHNKNIGGATGSRHSKGQAADIYINGVAPIEIAKYAESIGILGIGLYETNADGHFVHIDTRDTKSFWYGQKQEYRSTFGKITISKEESKIDTSKVSDKPGDPKIIWDFLKTKGLNDYGIAGLMGNLEAESSLKPTNLQNGYEKTLGYTDAEYTAAVDQGIYTNFVNDKAGYGLAQWTPYSRKQNMLNFHKRKNKSIGDLITQLEFLLEELTTNYNNSVLKVLKNATSVLEASNAVLLKFECPSDQSIEAQNRRASLCQKYYDKYHIIISVDQNKGGTNTMKYNANNKPLVCMMTQSTCYKGTSKMAVKGVLWHSTGVNNPTLKRYVQPSDNAPDKAEMLKLLGTNSNKNDWNHATVQAGLNCWIGKLADGTVTTVQTMPWDYKPWGCGAGAKGSCNNGWIQFEICEDGLTDKVYFDKVYKEACEITAYLCDMYGIDPKGTVNVNGVEVPTILCHADSHKLGLGSNHGDVNHWFPKHGKSMADAREDVAKLMKATSSAVKPQQPKEEEKKEEPAELYRVRKTWEDAKSQIGAYSKLENAKDACDKAGAEYKVFDSKGNLIYPKKQNEIVYKVGDEIKLLSNATYVTGKAIPKWVFSSKLYVRGIYENGNIVFSTQKTRDITGVVSSNYVIPYNVNEKESAIEIFKPYIVKITTDVLNVRAGAGTQYKITTQVKRNCLFTIVAEKGNWGKLKSGAGWICLDYTKKV